MSFEEVTRSEQIDSKDKIESLAPIVSVEGGGHGIQPHRSGCAEIILRAVELAGPFVAEAAVNAKPFAQIIARPAE